MLSNKIFQAIKKGKEYLGEKDEEPYVLTLPQSAGMKTWFDGYDAQEVLIIDEFSSQIPLDYLKKLLDSTPMRVETKGSTRKANWRYVIVTSQHNPDNWYKGWREIEIEDKNAIAARFSRIGECSLAEKKNISQKIFESILLIRIVAHQA